MNKRIARTAKSKMNGDDAPVEGGLQSLFVEGKNFIHYNPNDYQHTKQKSIRSRINGILALTSLEKLLVPNIYDISLGGLSFLHANEKDVSNSLFKMDIVIFDIQTDFEYLITGVKGWVNSKELSLEPCNRVPILAIPY